MIKRLSGPFYLSLLFLFMTVSNVFAAHIVGGDVTYRFLSFNQDSSVVTFEITVTMYRDALGGGAGFDAADQTSFGVFRRRPQGDWVLVEDRRGVGPQGIRPVPPNDLDCVEEPTNQVEVEQGFYRFNVDLVVNDQDYMIAYQRCCRNESIANIRLPGDTGAVFDVIICLLYTSPSPRDRG